MLSYIFVLCYAFLMFFVSGGSEPPPYGIPHPSLVFSLPSPWEKVARAERVTDEVFQSTLTHTALYEDFNACFCFVMPKTFLSSSVFCYAKSTFSQGEG